MEQTVIIRKPNKSEEARKAACLEQLADGRRTLLNHWPFIGGVIMRMNLVPVRDDRLETACTDGDNIFIDTNFYSALIKEERLFVLAHEVWHSVLLHFARLQDRDVERFNIAADLEIHFTLEDDKAIKKMTEPFVLLHDYAWKGLSAEEIYERLPEFWSKNAKAHIYGGGEAKQSQSHENNGKTNKKFGDGKKSFDKHIYKRDSKDNEGGQSDHGKHGQAGEIVIDSDYAPCIDSETVERSRARSIASAQQIERLQGKLPANVEKLIEMLKEPSLPWQEMLKQFVTTCYGGKRRWLPPARRHVWQDLYLPSMRSEALKAVVALDTSGSTQGDMPVFFGELVSLMHSFGKFDLDVIQCDAEIKNVEHYSEANLPPPGKQWEVEGLGGTDFRPVFDYIRKNMREQPDLLLFFTDGYGNAPSKQPAYPVMWVLTHDGRKPAEWGRTANFKNGE